MTAEAQIVAEKPSPTPVATQISGVSVIFDFGHGHITRRGASAAHYSQADVIDQYGRVLNETLDSEGVRVAPVQTRKPPGLSYTERLERAPAGFVPLILSCDFHDAPTARLHNTSVIEYQGDSYFRLAERLGEALSEWGRCYVWGHRVSRPVAVQGAPRDFISLRPFSINGPHADEYLRRLDQLGESLGRAIGGYLLEKNQGRVRAR